MSDNIIQCNSLEDVRKQIDSIDEKLITLIAQRSLYVKQAASFKKTTNEVIASDRIEKVIEKIKEMACKQDLNPLVAEKIYRIMIKSFIEQEMLELNLLYQDVRKSYY